MNFADRFEQLRADAGVGVRELARDAECSGSFIIRVEAGDGYPGIELMLDIADALSLSDDEAEELVARRMAERYGCGDAWQMWEMAAARVIREVAGE